MKKIVVIGSSNTDFVIKTSRIPKPGETIMGGQFMMTAGGKGANQAVAAARLGGDVAFIARVGDDMFGHKSIDSYVKDSLDTSSVSIDKNNPSGVAIISVDDKGENSIVVASGANNALGKDIIKHHKELICGAKIVLIQLEIPIESVEYSIHIAYECNAKVILNPAPATELSDEIMRKLYLITPNRVESELLSGVAVKSVDDAKRAAKLLLDRGVENVIITLDSQGSLVANKDFCELIPIRKVDAIDTTAAGDVFNGALCVALSEGKDLISAAKFATLASSISVTRMGAQTSIPYRREVDELCVI